LNIFDQLFNNVKQKQESMKKEVVVWSLVFAVLAGMAGCHSRKEPVRIIDRKYREAIRESRKEAIFYLARNFMPGSSVAVSVKGKTVWSEGFGLASTDLDVPATRQTKYRIGATSQVLTSLAYYRMVEQGKLSPHDTVQKYLPDFPKKKYPLTLQHLVEHTSGIRTLTEEEANWRGLNVTLQKGIESFSNDTLLFPPGMYHYPSEFNYNLLGVILQEAEGESFSKVIRKWVTDTLKLENTVPDHPLITIKGRADFYDHDIITQTIHATTRDLRHRLPADGFLSTADDLLKLGNAFLYPGIISDSLRKQIWTAPTISGQPSMGGMRWANGWLLFEDQEGNPFYAAHGSLTGGSSLLLIFPKEELVLAWVANIGDEMDELPGMKVAQFFRNFLAGKEIIPKQEQEPTDQPEEEPHAAAETGNDAKK